ncbi:Crp/Fnr family transcriptional regulator [Rhizobium sp. NTR19]|uniref:Crp/Fnr family transcriptional regulator n=1 Tax=Neorhizobium turbinariae TaxID=2937795 RepID=A0ABT0IXQ7_9HYPH|nr:Crp/Fnr family transcriptional regulator [Neorhizobium turbinariae]MCK8782668.1 Crp/Fnr family transcriptional regulator [Neorhizobium turbinariae]
MLELEANPYLHVGAERRQLERAVVEREYRNVLLKIGRDCISCIEPHLERVELKKLQMLAHPGEPLAHVYFPEESLASVASHIDEKRDVELGLIGREGMTGEAIVLGDDRSPFAIRAQMAGLAWRLDAPLLKAAVEENSQLRSLLLRYVRAQQLQVASTAASNVRGRTYERLARWLLMGFDRIDGDCFRCTHDALAYMVASRRPSVTDAFHLLEEKGAIRSLRNVVVIRNLEKLQDIAGSSYGLAEREYARLLGTDFRDHNKRYTNEVPPELFTEDVPHDEGEQPPAPA